MTKNKTERNRKRIEEIIEQEKDRNRFTGTIKFLEKTSRPSFDGSIQEFNKIVLSINPIFPNFA